MLFNSFQFGVFFIIVYCLYLFLDHKWQNRMLLVASCIFYGAWSWRFLLLMFISITTDYICGIKIFESNTKRTKKAFLCISISVNLFILGFFKYFNFFARNLQDLFSFIGLDIHINFLHVILPIGISFYTFQAMSYVLDIYRKKLEPTRSFRDYALFVAYFPQLVAGPIMRAKDLLPQISHPRRMTLDKFYEGCYLIFWGLFQKVFIADNLAKIVDPVFGAAPPYNGVKVLLAVYAFAFQIYCDFAGYSDIARGLGKCMGFDIMINFNLPYFSTNPKEFWKRWHISLSSWFKDYLYIPLGGNKNGTLATYRNLAITMFLVGLWHGAAWTFVFWGCYHWLLLVIYKLLKPLLDNVALLKKDFAKKTWFFIKVLFFFHLVCLGWLIFRASSINQFFEMFKAMFFKFQFTGAIRMEYTLFQLVLFLWVLILVQLDQYRSGNLMNIFNWNPLARGVLYFVCFYLLIMFRVEGAKEFIYFQF